LRDFFIFFLVPEIISTSYEIEGSEVHFFLTTKSRE